ncbi:heme lyase CcmF/NrfE family subunit [Collinsella tanakaei]|uniref:heme lyase CcmF/NrfE family subunit n=1 Tax=Collinsella tanakaei TaxID=626935 RepID=UPI001958BB54|nr:cytochrome c biogenesis protein CcsA [Collinsella tanakaei]MBM6868850.1 cytochrome c biogenesis protein CcsA [Collinsella tanakaei]
MMSTLGNALQILALVIALVSAVCLFAGVKRRRESLVNLGYILVFANALLLTACIGIILVCLLTENYSLAYVVSNFPKTDSTLKPLYQVSAVWAGRQGSLLLWTWLISIYAAVVAWRRMRVTDDLSSAALGVTEVICALFTATLVFSESNNPFMATAPEYLNADGTLVSPVGGMNPLLMHWAMILHPPATFVGYAGATLPFAYAMAALICGDMSARWVELTDRIAVFSFIFLTIGMALGAVWAYVVLGWGGFWAWDAVENASLFSWLTAVAMIHSFTMYRKHGCFKRWSMFAATLTFIFVVLGTFITRSGLVQSVHAFAEDPVSTYFFLGIMVLSGLAFLIGLLYRHGSYEDNDEIESMISKNGSYYLTNIVMVVAAILCAYLTVSSSLPGILPLGGQVIAAGAYNAVARPVGTLFCLLMAVCPMLGWRKTDGAAFARNMRVPAVLGAVLFCALMALFVTKFAPLYDQIVADGGDAAAALTEQGPKAYYFALTVAAFLAAALLFASSAYLLARGVSARMRNKGDNPVMAVFNLFRHSPAQAGGYLTHLGVAIVLVGLVGSSMYVREVTLNLDATEGQSAQVGAYELEFTGTSEYADANDNMIKQVDIDVYDAASGAALGHISPSMEASASNTGQQTLHASVLSFPLEDLFVAFQGLNADGSLSIHVKVNPLIMLNWIGAGVAVLGIVLAFAPRRATPLLAADDRAREEGASHAA